MTTPAPAPKKRSKWPLACGGCLGVIALTVCLVVAAVALVPKLRLNADEAYSGAPDPVASAAVRGVFDDAGLEGVDALVIPIKGRDGQIAIITLDETMGFTGAGSLGGNDALFDDVMQGLASANESEDLRIERVAFVYDDGSGIGPIAMTASQETLDAYAAGEISRDEMLAGFDVDISGIISYEQLMSLIEEGE